MEKCGAVVVFLADVTLTGSEIRVIGVAFIKSLVRLGAVYTSVVYMRACTHVCVCPYQACIDVRLYACNNQVIRLCRYLHLSAAIRTTPCCNEQTQATA